MFRIAVKISLLCSELGSQSRVLCCMICRAPDRLSRSVQRMAPLALRSSCLFLYELLLGKMATTCMLKQVTWLSVQGGLGSMKIISVWEHFSWVRGRKHGGEKKERALSLFMPVWFFGLKSFCFHLFLTFFECRQRPSYVTGQVMVTL